jgi:hypothetical protein
LTVDCVVGLVPRLYLITQRKEAVPPIFLRKPRLFLAYIAVLALPRNLFNLKSKI